MKNKIFSMICKLLMGMAFLVFSSFLGFAEDDLPPEITRLEFQKPSGQAMPETTRILVKFKKDLPEDARAEFYKKHDLKKHSRIEKIDIDVLELGEGKKARDAVEGIKRADQDRIEYVEEDAILAPALIPNDTYYSMQWHLPKIKGPQAWDVTVGDSRVRIAILDSGVDGTHPELASLMVPGWNFYDNNADTSDVHGHGTAVAGHAAAVGNNGHGIASVCWNCQIMPIRISAPDGSGISSAMAQGLIWAADQGARIANISYGGVSSLAVVNEAAQYFRSQGGLVFISAGNSSVFDSKTDNPNFIMVSASDQNDYLAFWSNRGNNIDLSAPGSSIFTVCRGGAYCAGTGTSFSSPLAAAVGALIFSANPSLTNTQVEEILKESADDLGTWGWDSFYGWGRINAGLAVHYAIGNRVVDVNPPAAPTNLTAKPKFNTEADLSWTLPYDDTEVIGFRVYRNGEFIMTLPAVTTFADTRVTQGASYTYALQAFDHEHNLSPFSEAVFVDLSQGPADTVPPAAPVACSAASYDRTSANVSWSFVSDNVKVAEYKVYREEALRATVSADSDPFNPYLWKDTEVTPGATYTYFVAAVDTSNNMSAFSPRATVTVSTLEPPLPRPLDLQASISEFRKVALTWGPVEDVRLTGYRIWRGTTSNSFGLNGESVVPTYTDLNAVPGATYWYSVNALGANGAVSSYSDSIKVVIPSDTTPPSAPANLAAVASNSAAVNLSWGASNDDVGITGYLVYRGGSLLVTTVSTTYADTMITAGASYSYFVKALDGAGNYSPASNTASVTVPDLAAISAPASLVASAKNTFVTLNWADHSTNEQGFYIERAAKVKNGLGSYARVGQVGAGVITYNETVASGTYAYRVQAFNATLGKVSDYSNTVTVQAKTGRK